MYHLRLWQLVSPALPIGAFAYSDGLESAIDSGIANNAERVSTLLHDIASRQLVHVDIPFLRALGAACETRDAVASGELASQLAARRETAELYASDQHLGHALVKVLPALDIPASRFEAPARAGHPIPFAWPFAYACTTWQVPTDEMLQAYLWVWLEGQLAAATKLVPLGQSEAQHLLFSLATNIPAWVEEAHDLPAGSPGAPAIAWAILSSAHETQYSRLFRS